MTDWKRRLEKAVRNNDKENFYKILSEDEVIRGLPKVKTWTTKKESPFHQAVGKNKPEMLQAMLHLGAKVDALCKIDDGRSQATALFVAASNGSSSCLSLLLNAGAKVNYGNKLPDGDYLTALHRAIYRKHKECIKILLENGAAPIIKGKYLRGDPQYEGSAWDFLDQMRDSELTEFVKQIYNNLFLKNSISKDEIGSGSFGKVSIHSYKGQKRAVKRLQIDFDQLSEIEIKAMESLDHENVVQFFGHIIKDGYLLLHMELCSMDLKAYFKALISIEAKTGIMLQLARGLEHIHSHGIIHRDIKPANVLVRVFDDGKEVFKLADFGLAKIMTARDSSMTMSMSVVGTKDYMAPEVVKASWKRHDDEEIRVKGYVKSVDIFSLSSLFYWIIAGKVPFNEEELGNGTYDAKNTVEAEFDDKTLQQLLIDMMNIDPSLRPTAANLVEVLDSHKQDLVEIAKTKIARADEIAEKLERAQLDTKSAEKDCQSVSDNLRAITSSVNEKKLQLKNLQTELMDLEYTQQKEDTLLQQKMSTKAQLLEKVEQLENDPGYISPDSLSALKVDLNKFG